MSDQWGPWIDHDGRGCPCLGAFVQSVDLEGLNAEHIAGGFISGIDMDGSAPVNCWDFADCHQNRYLEWLIVRYRIRRPRGMQVLDAIIADLPVEVDA